MLHPEPAPPGTVIRVVAPSGPFDEASFQRGLGHFADYDLRFGPEMMGRRSGFLAGDDGARLRELQAALDSEDASVIWLARGGFGLSRIAHRLDWDAFQERPKWVVGFSDGTVLHQACLARNVTSLHGPNVTSLEDDASAASLRGALVGSWPNAWPVSCWIPGPARGPLVGGNLTMLCMLATAGALRLPAGCLLFLEDVDETSYRVDRMLTALIVGGHLAGVSAIVLGGFTNCGPGRFEVPVEEVLLSTLGRLGVPIVAGFPSGHGAERETWLHGGAVELDAEAGLLRSLGWARR